MMKYLRMTKGKSTSRAVWTTKVSTTLRASIEQSVQQRSLPKKSRSCSVAVPGDHIIHEVETVQKPSNNAGHSDRAKRKNEDEKTRWQGLKQSISPSAAQNEDVSSVHVCEKCALPDELFGCAEHRRYTSTLLMMHREIQMVIARGPPGLQAPVPPGLGQRSR